MFVSQQVSKSFLDRLTAEYHELYQSVQLNTSDQALSMKKVIRARLEAIMAMKALAGEGSLDTQLQRTLKLELRSAQRTWMRHLVTSARLSRQRSEKTAGDYLNPIAAA